jgi:beta-glucanase (GH16 family)
VVQEAPAPPAPLPPPPPSHERRLLLDDHFDGVTLDPATWAPGYWTPGNAFYAPENVSQAEGRLRLRATSPTSGAMVQTLGRVALERGRVEVRAQTPYGQGLWPAIWLRPVDLAQEYPEIDALETWQTDAQATPFNAHTLWMNYHWLDGVHKQAQTTYVSPDDLTAGMHDYAVEWKPGRISWYVDGVRRGRIDGPQVATTPMFLVLSLQVGEWWFPGDTGKPSPKTRFPADLEIDRVRVWEDPPDA